MIIELIHTDLPLPVVPATNKCGVLTISTVNILPLRNGWVFGGFAKVTTTQGGTTSGNVKIESRQISNNNTTNNISNTEVRNAKIESGSTANETKGKQQKSQKTEELELQKAQQKRTGIDPATEKNRNALPHGNSQPEDKK